jgi:hypothetical protein
LVVGWHHVNGGNRTTMFSPARWRCEIANRVVSLHRVKPDPLEMDMPWISANLYTIEQQKNN